MPKIIVVNGATLKKALKRHETTMINDKEWNREKAEAKKEFARHKKEVDARIARGG